MATLESVDHEYLSVVVCRWIGDHEDDGEHDDDGDDGDDDEDDDDDDDDDEK